MKNKNGFISMSLVYSFLVLFLFLMMSIINCYLKKNTYLEALDKQVSKDISITKDAKQSLFSTILEDNIALPSNTLNFTKIATTANKNGNGLYYIEDKNKTDENNDGYGSKIYFYRGTVDNNYVIFGSEIKRNDAGQVTEEKPICWRIIRTNEDGSIRLLYSGLATDQICPTSGLNLNLRRLDSKYDSYTDANNSVAFNVISSTEEYKDNAYVGYTYGGRISELADEEGFMTGKSDYELYEYTHHHDGSGAANSSNIKFLLDDYFLNHTNMYYSTEHNYQLKPPEGSTEPTESINLVNERIANAVYCNDRTIANSEAESIVVTPMAIANPDEETEERIGKGYSYYPTILDGYNRLWNGTPSYACKQSIDRYTLRTISGGTNQNSNALAYAIGLPTLDDVIYAGGANNTANSTYFMKGDTPYWTMTPVGSDRLPIMVAVTNTGALGSISGTSAIPVRPVISIDPTILVMSGNGLRNEPYVLK